MFRNFLIATALPLICGCGGQVGKSPSPGSQNQVSEADQQEEKRRTISFSKNRLTIKGIPVQVGTTPSADLEKIIGPPDRVVNLDGVPNSIAVWDKQGFRAYYFPKKSGKVDHFDCIFVIETDFATEPQSAFSGDFAIEGMQISKGTTKEMLQGKLSEKLRDHSVNLPGFSAKYAHHDISFEMTKDRKGLASVRISEPLGGRK